MTFGIIINRNYPYKQQQLMIQPERQVLTVHTVIYTCVITYTIIKMYPYAAYLYDIIVPLNYCFDMSQLNLPLAPKDPLFWPIEISLKHIKFWTCIVLVSLHMTWEPPTKLDWMKRLHWLTTISGCSRSRSSPGHSSGPDHIHSRRSSAWFAWHFFNLLQKKGS